MDDLIVVLVVDDDVRRDGSVARQWPKCYMSFGLPKPARPRGDISPKYRAGPLTVRSTRPAQPIDATQALNLSAGVSNANFALLRSAPIAWNLAARF
jgi:hypothetical protein